MSLEAGNSGARVASPAIFTVSVKLPEFCHYNQELWFQQVEAELNLH